MLPKALPRKLGSEKRLNFLKRWWAKITSSWTSRTPYKNIKATGRDRYYIDLWLINAFKVEVCVLALFCFYLLGMNFDSSTKNLKVWNHRLKKILIDLQLEKKVTLTYISNIGDVMKQCCKVLGYQKAFKCTNNNDSYTFNIGNGRSEVGESEAHLHLLERELPNFHFEPQGQVFIVNPGRDVRTRSNKGKIFSSTMTSLRAVVLNLFGSVDP